jgi:hypothetical protein
MVLGFFGGQQFAAKLNGFWFRSNMADEEVRSLKEQVFSFRSIRNKDFSRDLRSRNEASRDKGSRNYQGQPAWRVSRERTRHDCGSFPYFGAD